MPSPLATRQATATKPYAVLIEFNSYACVFSLVSLDCMLIVQNGYHSILVHGMDRAAAIFNIVFYIRQV